MIASTAITASDTTFASTTSKAFKRHTVANQGNIATSYPKLKSVFVILMVHKVL